MKDFLDNNNLHNLIQKPTCFKSSSGTCIDLILTNKKSVFFDSDTFETGLSDHHVLVHTTFKPTFEKLPPIQITYRNFKDFDETLFIEEIKYLLGNCLYPYDFSTFYNIVVSTINKFAPYKTIFVRGNNKPFISKKLKKEIRKRSRLKNKANKTSLQFDIENYKKQRNYVTSR